MSPPDLNTEDGRAAYRAELRGVARPLRFGGLAIVILGAIILVGMSRGWLSLPPLAMTLGYGLLALGWALWIAAIFIRTRHHKRRLAEGL